MEPQSAKFELKNFQFTQVIILAKNYKDSQIEVSFTPKGFFDIKKQIYKIALLFKAYNEEFGKDNSFITVELESFFEFKDEIEISTIPSYFYKNSLAIIYPYIRSFVSSATLQANVRPLILPTLNLSGLETDLRESTKDISL